MQFNISNSVISLLFKVAKMEFTIFFLNIALKKAVGAISFS